VRAGETVGTVAGTDEAEVIVPLRPEQLRWLSIPRRGSDEKGSPASIRVTAGGESFVWDGQLERSLGEVDPDGRMSRVVVSVADPYNLSGHGDGERPELESGLFVEVTITGVTLSEVVSIPRRALRDDSTVWVVDGEKRLRVRPVSIERRERETLLIKSGLEDGDLVVLTRLPGAADGMRLRFVGEGGTE